MTSGRTSRRNRKTAPGTGVCVWGGSEAWLPLPDYQSVCGVATCPVTDKSRSTRGLPQLADSEHFRKFLWAGNSAAHQPRHGLKVTARHREERWEPDEAGRRAEWLQPVNNLARGAELQAQEQAPSPRALKPPGSKGARCCHPQHSHSLEATHTACAEPCHATASSE